MADSGDKKLAVSIFSNLRRISPELFRLSSEPLFIRHLSIPFESLKKLFSKRFALQLASIKAEAPVWQELTNVTSGFGGSCETLRFKLGALHGSLQVLIPTVWLDKLSAIALQVDELLFRKQPIEFIHEAHQFLLAWLTAEITELQELRSLEIRRDETAQETDKTHYQTIDIHFEFSSAQFPLRLCLSEQLVRDIHEITGQEHNRELLNALELPIVLEAGKIYVEQDELKNIVAGTFIQIDKPYFTTRSDKRKCLVSLYGRSLFRARIKEQEVKILEAPLEYEELIPMSNISKSTVPKSNMSKTTPIEEDDIENNPFEGEEEPESSAMHEPAELPKKIELTPKELPITLTVELARLTMSVQKVLEFQPGTTFSLDSLDENQVYISCHNKILARGELLQIGDVIGVRIVDVGTLK